jgi:hypothetical protein
MILEVRFENEAFYPLPPTSHAPRTAQRGNQIFLSKFPLSKMLTQTITPSAPGAISAAAEMYSAVFERSLQFRIEMSYDRAVDFIREIDQYNCFQASTVLDALENVDRMIPRNWYDEGNPNNGLRSYTISVGREGSPVIYLDRWEFSSTPPLSEAAMRTICLEMETIAHADEADYQVQTHCWGRKIEFRFWWD